MEGWVDLYFSFAMSISLCYWDYNEANYENEDSKDKETSWIRTEFALPLMQLE
ncbi:hypothetical protein QG37_03580 [Candidozyma auris]|nr:hypothetical protein QG37_03580 [[Candida] auris]